MYTHPHKVLFFKPKCVAIVLVYC